jgi:hypothetical protein
LIALSNDWDRAMVRNDADAIGRYMADDWTIVGPDGSMSDKATFLGLVKSGALTHDVMESEDFRIRNYGSAAVVLARGAIVQRLCQATGTVEVCIDTPLATWAITVSNSGPAGGTVSSQLLRWLAVPADSYAATTPFARARRTTPRPSAAPRASGPGHVGLATSGGRMDPRSTRHDHPRTGRQAA